jgi:hypothetical protein
MALGVNNSNIMANGSSSRKSPMIGEALNNSSGNDTSTKKIGQPRQSIATHRSNSSNVSNSIKQAANQPQSSASFNMTKNRTARSSSGHQPTGSTSSATQSMSVFQQKLFE